MPEFVTRGESNYAALIGDIRASRSIPDRARVQRALRNQVAHLNSILHGEFAGAADALAAPIAMTAGDEVQALLTHPSRAVPIISALTDAIHPLRLQFGLGYGHVSTDLDPDVALVDGPCFHQARRAIEVAAHDRAWVRASGFGPTTRTDQVLEALFNLMDALRSRWTAKQHRYAVASLPAIEARLDDNAPRPLRKDLAARFHVSPSVITESLQAARPGAVLDGERAAAYILSEFDPPTE